MRSWPWPAASGSAPRPPLWPARQLPGQDDEVLQGGRGIEGAAGQGDRGGQPGAGVGFRNCCEILEIVEADFDKRPLPTHSCRLSQQLIAETVFLDQP